MGEPLTTTRNVFVNDMSTKRTMTVTIPPGRALRTALALLWSVCRRPRSPVTFYAWEDPA